ncbi:hypothetical protein BDY17DRAFT_296505 [Neohortaea acidophila]|uniref:Uncharacterized protein n=1 Tax=Neohortaea acidophila TaxID=245834 RepID=A0A6A6PTZ2_9PEZI|nr:uncharacterized protein BDY17DRAFT_296505 [Neohortaea acidophila]KAF2482933.1 hypothetical protein BDY17DRAFT_296505 [Neohortaea acidophila]
MTRTSTSTTSVTTAAPTSTPTTVTTTETSYVTQWGPPRTTTWWKSEYPPNPLHCKSKTLTHCQSPHRPSLQERSLPRADGTRQTRHPRPTRPMASKRLHADLAYADTGRTANARRRPRPPRTATRLSRTSPPSRRPRGGIRRLPLGSGPLRPKLRRCAARRHAFRA